MNNQNYGQPPPPPPPVGPPPVGPPPNDPYSNPGRGLSIAGLVLGIVGLVFAWVFYFGLPVAIVGLILSIIGMKKSKDAGYPAGSAMGGIICSAAAIVLSIICFVACAALIAEMGMDFADFF